MRIFGGWFFSLLTFTTIVNAQTFKTLVSFNNTDGSLTYYETLAQGMNGSFYGTTERGGTSTACEYNCGTIFRVTPAGTLKTLADLDLTDGSFPYSGLILATNEEFYGTTSGGGANGYGTIFKMTAGGTIATLHSFDASDGANPWAALVQATNGDLYGTTSYGGPYEGGYGTIFKISPSGTFTSLHSFDVGDGFYPYGTLIQATNGYLYGSTYEGGSDPSASCDPCYGTIFRMTPSGTFTTLHVFVLTDGAYPYGALVQAANGDLYGTTEGGGPSGNPGTIFKMTPAGDLTTFYVFCKESGCLDGEQPRGGLVQATDGNFYGTTTAGGTSGLGTVFEITPEGIETVLHNFDGMTDGQTPYGTLLQATDGSFYGTTFNGGPAGGYGTVYRLSTGLAPFVKTIPTSANVGDTIIILGNKLTGSTSVTFDGTPAIFTVNSYGTAITTTVPEGATTGTVEVTTPSSILSSNVPFRVM
jgi:uncharacterized repeat protein (TIGR03803 family)